MTGYYWDDKNEYELLRVTLASIRPQWDLSKCYFWENISAAYRENISTLRWLGISLEEFKQDAAIHFCRKSAPNNGKPGRSGVDGIYERMKSGDLVFENEAHFSSFWRSTVNQFAKVRKRDAIAALNRVKVAMEGEMGIDAEHELYDTINRLVKTGIQVVKQGKVIGEFSGLVVRVRNIRGRRQYAVSDKKGKMPIMVLAVWEEHDGDALLADELSVLPVGADGLLKPSLAPILHDRISKSALLILRTIAVDAHKTFGARNVEPRNTNDELVGRGRGVGNRFSSAMTRIMKRLG